MWGKVLCEERNPNRTVWGAGRPTFLLPGCASGQPQPRGYLKPSELWDEAGCNYGTQIPTWWGVVSSVLCGVTQRTSGLVTGQDRAPHPHPSDRGAYTDCEHKAPKKGAFQKSHLYLLAWIGLAWVCHQGPLTPLLLYGSMNYPHLGLLRLRNAPPEPWTPNVYFLGGFDNRLPGFLSSPIPAHCVNLGHVLDLSEPYFPSLQR